MGKRIKEDVIYLATDNKIKESITNITIKSKPETPKWL
jgi:hypothetical protein